MGKACGMHSHGRDIECMNGVGLVESGFKWRDEYGHSIQIFTHARDSMTRGYSYMHNVIIMRELSKMSSVTFLHRTGDAT